MNRAIWTTKSDNKQVNKQTKPYLLSPISYLKFKFKFNHQVLLLS